MDFKDVLDHRRATRKFSSQQVNDKVLTQIIEDAQRAPSLLNSQPWRVYVAQGEVVDKIRKEFQDLVEAGEPSREDFSKLLKVEWDVFPSKNMSSMSDNLSFFLRGEMDQFQDAQEWLYDAHTFIYMTIPKKSPAWSLFDLGAFSQTLMLSAANHGLATMPSHQIVKYPDVIRKYLPISEDEAIGMAIGIGYPDKRASINSYHSKRLPVDSILKITK
ncbi:nitroreductase [Lactobacillus sp. PV037]|uniref:nitroreductase n=1 Tax=unclassified Lactobacillus TaxID=2620435 RepID=UPI00223E9083|nr:MULTISPECIES: nitroreductase [unclassified Lactobacillus]QNQ82621.1 nitroreductase [Lactobacillus sp. PV012]QNQ83266.1 nitroreductase [Lactobacillus sp. PV037]